MRPNTLSLGNEELKTRLAQVPPQKLAEALVDIRFLSEVVEATIERLLSNSKERLERFHSRLQGYLGPRKPGYVPPHELEGLLLELQDSDIDPTDGFLALMAFYRADEELIEAYDDSGNSVGFLYDYTAVKLLVGFASKLEESEVIDQLVDLLRKDTYGARLAILEKVGEFLSVDGIRRLLTRLRTQHSGDRLTALHLQELAKQLGDVVLFEELLTSREGHLKTEHFVALARLHFDKGHFQQTLDTLARDPENKAARHYEGEKMRLECLKQLGQTAELQIAAWQNFSEYPEKDRFEELVSLVGEERRPELEEKAVKLVTDSPEFRPQSALLLMSLEREPLAEEYVLSRHEQLKDALYTYLAQLAQAFRTADYYLASTLCYRALLVDILERGRSKAYHHAADYFEALCDTDDYVAEWRGFSRHAAFVRELKAQHGRKLGFWRRVQG